jgi:hypothetical protein
MFVYRILRSERDDVRISFVREGEGPLVDKLNKSLGQALSVPLELLPKRILGMDRRP